MSSPCEGRQDDSVELSRKSFREQMLSSLSKGFSEHDTHCERSEEARTEASDGAETNSFNILEENRQDTSKLSAFKSKRLHQKGVCDDSTAIKMVKLDIASSSGVPAMSTTHQSTDHHGSKIGASGTSSGDNKGFVCESNVCFTKRTKNASDSSRLPIIKYKWHNPPKHIFKPTVQVLISCLFSLN